MRRSEIFKIKLQHDDTITIQGKEAKAKALNSSVRYIDEFVSFSLSICNAYFLASTTNELEFLLDLVYATDFAYLTPRTCLAIRFRLMDLL